MTTGQTASVEKFGLDVVLRLFLQPLFSRSKINFELQKVPFILEKVKIQNDIQWTSTRCQCLMLTGSWNGWPRTRIQSRPGSSTTTLSFLHAVHRCQGGEAHKSWRIQSWPDVRVPPLLVLSPLTEWAIWAAREPATGPSILVPCPLGIRPARRPGRAGRDQRSSLARQAGACFDDSSIQRGQKMCMSHFI